MAISFTVFLDKHQEYDRVADIESIIFCFFSFVISIFKLVTISKTFGFVSPQVFDSILTASLALVFSILNIKTVSYSKNSCYYGNIQALIATFFLIKFFCKMKKKKSELEIFYQERSQCLSMLTFCPIIFSVIIYLSFVFGYSSEYSEDLNMCVTNDVTKIFMSIVVLFFSERLVSISISSIFSSDRSYNDIEKSQIKGSIVTSVTALFFCSSIIFGIFYNPNIRMIFSGAILLLASSEIQFDDDFKIAENNKKEGKHLFKDKVSFVNDVYYSDSPTELIYKNQSIFLDFKNYCYDKKMKMFPSETHGSGTVMPFLMVSCYDEMASFKNIVEKKHNDMANECANRIISTYFQNNSQDSSKKSNSYPFSGTHIIPFPIDKENLCLKIKNDDSSKFDSLKDWIIESLIKDFGSDYYKSDMFKRQNYINNCYEILSLKSPIYTTTRETEIKKIKHRYPIIDGRNDDYSSIKLFFKKILTFFRGGYSRPSESNFAFIQEF